MPDKNDCMFFSPGRPWKNSELETLYYMRRDGIPYRLIALELKRTVKSCERKYQGVCWENTPFHNKSLTDLDNVTRRSLKEKISQAQDKKAENYRIRAEIIGDRMAMAIKSLPDIPPPVYRARKTQKHHEDEHVGLMLSDMHIGHNHTLGETGGISEYNVEIFAERMRNLKYAVADISELHSNLYHIPELHIFSLGDVVAGMNATGNWNNTYINLPIFEQMITGFEALAEAIYYWLGFFEKIHFYGVRGNHGRAAPQGIEKDYINWDYICYKFLEERFRQNPRVELVVPNSWWIIRNIKKHNFLIVHGDDLRKCATSLKSVQDYELRMTGITKVISDYTLAGHYHSSAELSTNNGRILINGSFMGSDVFSLKTIHAASRPEQKIFGIHSKRGITWTYNVDLDYDRDKADQILDGSGHRIKKDKYVDF